MEHSSGKLLGAQIVEEHMLHLSETGRRGASNRSYAGGFIGGRCEERGNVTKSVK